MSFLTTFYNLIQYFLKNVFVTDFPFLMDSHQLQPPEPPPNPLAAKICKTLRKFFVDALQGDL